MFNKGAEYNEIRLIFASYIMLLVMTVVSVSSVGIAVLLFLVRFFTNSLIKR